ncbi:MAG: hypothetical protein ABH844_05275 [Candidatus Omnitrophota bacterium]
MKAFLLLWINCRDAIYRVTLWMRSLGIEKCKGRDAIYRVSMLRGGIAGIFAIGLCFVFIFSGCGKKQEQESVSKTEIVQEEAEDSWLKQEIPVPSTAPILEERVYYDFETDLSGWEIPMWTQDKSDYSADKVEVSRDVSSQGSSSMKIDANFPGGSWIAALVEIQQYLDLTPYRVISADFYLPSGGPMGLKVKLILTIGEEWKFVEMSRSIILIPGEWVTLTASIEPGSYDWKRIIPDETFAEDVRKIAVRIESNKKPKYSGSIYVDNIRCGK